MAEHLRHAAGRATYEVREILDGDAWIDMDVLYRCNDYEQAVDFAFDYLGRRDPRRTGAVGGLQVLKDDGGGRRETVWTYRHAEQAEQQSPMSQWGFDVTRRWLGPSGGAIQRPTPPRSRVARRV